MFTLFEYITKIIENPAAKNNYILFKDYLKKENRNQELQAIEHLISKKFDDNHSNSNSEQ
jgi:uncharacterized FlgJ-related protein